MISPNLLMKLYKDCSFELRAMEQNGLTVLFEMQKCKDPELSKNYCTTFVNYLVECGATYLALFFMKSFSLFNREASDLALNNAIAIISKVENINNLFLVLIF